MQESTTTTTGAAAAVQPLPPLTPEDLMAAYILIRPLGVPFDQAMNNPAHYRLRRVILCKAALIRSDRWLQTQVHRVACVPRAVLGADGHPVGYAATQRDLPCLRG